MDRWMDVLMDGWMDGRFVGWVNCWIIGWVARWMDGWMQAWMDGVGRWVDGWMGWCVDGSMKVGWIQRQTDRCKDEMIQGRTDGWTAGWFYKRMVSEQLERKGERQARNKIW